jgi:dTDP-4-dehydrorhamnose reductase
VRGIRILVTGAAGFLGRALGPALAAGGHVVTAADRGIDVRDPAALAALGRRSEPEVIVHLAARALIDDVAADPEGGWEVNVAGTANVVALGRAHGAHLLLLSTDSVFDGTAGPYGESDAPNPINAYGRTKRAAEDVVAAGGGSWLVVRTSLIYGWPPPGRHVNFAARVVRTLRAGRSITAYTDMLRTPIYVDDLARLLARVIELRARGLVHLAGAEAVSMARFAEAVATGFDLDPALIVAAATPPGDRSRSRALGLRGDRARQELGLSLPALDAGLARMRAAEGG